MSRIFHSIKKVIRKKLIITTRKRTNLFIIGEQKCGTTSLFQLLIRNPNILPASIKECHYFNTDKIIHDKNYHNYHGLYRQLAYKKYKYQLDASADYLTDENSAEYTYTYNPGAKIIIMLRNPVARFISAYNFYFSNIVKELDANYPVYFQFSEKGKARYDYLKKNPGLTIEQFLEDELTGKSPLLGLSRGHYFEHIARWEKYFDKKNICVLNFENLISPIYAPAETGKLGRFLSLSLDTNFPKENISSLETIVPADIIVKLENYFQFEIEQLRIMSERKNENKLISKEYLDAYHF